MNTDEIFEKEIERKIAKKIAKIVAAVVGGFVFIVLFCLIGAFIVKWLWSVTLVPIFGISAISYWQAIGLFLLAKIFFGFGGGGMKHNPKKDQENREQVNKWWKSKWTKSEAMPEGELLKKYWEEEGKAAFEAYRRNHQVNGDRDGTDNSSDPPQ